MNNIFTINENLRIFDNGSDEIRLRIGIWNYNEAVLDLNGQTDGFKSSIRDLFVKMQSGKGIDQNDIEGYSISRDDKNSVMGLLEGLTSAGMVCKEEDRKVSNQIVQSLLGDYKYYVRPDNNKAFTEPDRKVIFISDSDYCKKTAVHLSGSMELKLDLISDELYKDISVVDLTTRVDAFNTISNIEKLKKDFEGYSTILVCMHRVKISLLRNINRIALALEKNVVVSFIDGPFITAFSINPSKTGCIECFEQRALSRMEDHVSYHNFINTKINESKEENKGVIPILNMLANIVISEGYLINNLGASKFEGRILSIYVPSLEIQVDDILRVPFCPACGTVAKADFAEMNISSRRLVDDIVSKIMR
ncbi:streptolysin associated protein SagC [Clostridium algidicarnis]|uniref:streptolysin associated protein SagC n=1 Tax=Clostridium algidicarnis TaxID=37659 RepID=UPI00049703C7|nr:streptolysin associated protein SagC [Clostridium algidicarnis]